MMNMMLPTFIICGAQKGGTTALYDYLKEHPDICIPPKKELHYFDLNYYRGVKWYEKQFKGCKKNEINAIGEASPFYMYLEEVPERIHALLPDVKLIFILRNPIDRAYSHYWHEVKLGYEYLSFEKAIEKEEERLAKGDLFSKQHYSYKDRGKYVIQLKRYRKYFPREQMLILVNEELRENPQYTMKKIFGFLGVDVSFTSSNWYTQHHKGKQPRIWKLQQLKGKLAGNLLGNKLGHLIDFMNLKEGYPPMNHNVRKELAGYFEAYNMELERFLGKKMERWQCKNLKKSTQ